MLLRAAPILGLIFLGGCAYHVAEQTDQIVASLARKSFDREPPEPAKVEGPSAAAQAAGSGQPAGRPPQTPEVAKVAKDVQTASYLEAGVAKDPKESPFDLKVPDGIPGSEVPEIRPKTKEELIKEVTRLYPPLPPLPQEPKPLPRADGLAYTLSELQEIAAINSPLLKQAASDVKAAQGNLIQARTLPNPTGGYRFDPSNDGETAGVQGGWIDQKIPIGGKRRLSIAAAQKDYDNAELALKRARSDLATSVRNAYFGFLVAKETVRVNQALATLTDEIYRAQVSLVVKGGLNAGYEPAPLRAQAYAARLAMRQAITSYQFAWKNVANAVGLRQLPLSEVAGRIDAHIPYFDYDAVAAHVLNNHTDILSARNALGKTRFNLKLARVLPYLSDVDVMITVEKEFSLQPFQWFAAGQVGFTLPFWDHNKGNIMAAEAALIRAAEQPHAAELNLTYNLQNAYTNYKNNLDALDYYRRHILPDQVRAYRGVLERRQLDQNAQFGDLVQAQQMLATNVASYLNILGQLWTSAVTVADFLQTDDLFALARPQAVPALPDVEQLAPLPCCHPSLKPPPANRAPTSGQVSTESSGPDALSWLPPRPPNQTVGPMSWPGLSAWNEGFTVQPAGGAAAQQQPGTVPDARSGP